MLNHIGTQTIKTSRLILRRFAECDLESMFSNWASDEKVQSDYGEPVYSTIDEAKGLLDKYISSYEKCETYRWAVVSKDNGECIGQVAYFLVDTHNQFCEIEYCIGQKYQNQGYITEAVKAIVDFGFQNVNFNRIQVSHRHVNIASRHVIEKCGFTYEGSLRKFFNHLGEFHDRLYYSILHEEWIKMSARA